MTDELISKTDVVKIVKSVLSPASSLTNVARARRQMLDQIYELESKPEPHWIPVTERLPELRHDVLLTVFFHEKWNVAEGYRQDGEFMFWNNGRLDSVLDEENRVIAWMLKPEPYKGVTDGRD